MFHERLPRDAVQVLEMEMVEVRKRTKYHPPLPTPGEVQVTAKQDAVELLQVADEHAPAGNVRARDASNSNVELPLPQAANDGSASPPPDLSVAASACPDRAGDLNSSPQLTVFTKTGGSLSKIISHASDGRLIKDSAECRMSNGRARRFVFTGDPAAGLANLISTLTASEALALGRLPEGTDDIGITYEANAHIPHGYITRTARNFTYAQGQQSFMLIDVDTKAAHTAVVERLRAVGIEGILAGLLPAINATARVHRASTSAGLRTFSGERIGEVGGAHLYLLVQDGADIPRALKVLAARLWLSGYGWIALSRSGAFLERSPVDTAVGGAERLIFEGGPVLVGLTQDHEARRPRATAGQALDTHVAIPDLTSDEQARYEALVSAAKADTRPLAEQKKAEYLDCEVEKLVVSGVTHEQARAAVIARSRGDLAGSTVIDFDDGTGATVAQILADPKAYHGKPCADPVEGREYGATTAMVYSDQARPVINSFAHGGAKYFLHPGDVPANDAGDDEALVRIHSAVTRLAAMDACVREMRIKDEARALGVSVSFLRAEVNRELQRQPRARTDGRVELEVNDADLPATAKNVAKLVADMPMIFDRGGPARLAFDAAKGGLVCDHLTQEGVQIAVHNVAQPYHWVEKQGVPCRSDITLPRPVATLYLDMKGGWGLRPLNGITTTPLLSADGCIHVSDGYDVRTGMWCEKVPTVIVPENPTREDATVSLMALRRQFRTFACADSKRVRDVELGVDVVDLSQPPGADESAALVALMTAVARPSLPLAPALAVIAPAISGAGTGKGLLVRAICAIAIGVKPRAMTAGGDNAELDKRITASLIGAEPVLFIDNLNSRTLKSDLLASAITECPAVVRTLGKSDQVLINPTAFVAVTGNGLEISEDLTRRFLTVELDAGVEDPEARPFKGDLIQEVLDRRGELLRDVLTIWRWGRQSDLPMGRTLGSFGSWGKWCRDPLVALGCQDPVIRICEAKANDPRRQEIGELFETWWYYHTNTPVTAADLHFGVKSILDPQSKGRQFLAARVRKLEGTRYGGFVLTRIDRGGSAAEYRLLRLKADKSADHVSPNQKPVIPAQDDGMTW